MKAQCIFLASVVAVSALSISNGQQIKDIPTKKLIGTLREADRISFPFDQLGKGALHFEHLLVEIGRRDRESLTDSLRSYAKQYNRPYSRRAEPNFQKRLELITTLRRIEKRPDPLAITIFQPEGEMTGLTRDLPVLDVALTNVDILGEDLPYKTGGDYRGGREARWRIHLWDSENKLLPTRSSRLPMAGGLFGYEIMKKGQSIKTRLPIAAFVDVLDAGTYRVQVYYHNAVTIADIKDPKALDELIYFKSEPFQLAVKKGPMIEIKVRDELKDQFEEDFANLLKEDDFKIVWGEYDRRYHSFVEPDSPQGRILTMKWQAVPYLIARLEAEDRDFEEIARAFSLLFAITGEADYSPLRHPGVLPNNYEYQSRNLSGEVNGSGSSSGPVRPGNPKLQEPLRQKWLRFSSDYFKLAPSS